MQLGESSLMDQRGQIHSRDWISAFLMNISYRKNLTCRGDAVMEVAAYLLGSGSYYIQRSTNPLGCILLQITVVTKLGDTLKF